MKRSVLIKILFLVAIYAAIIVYLSYIVQAKINYVYLGAALVLGLLGYLMLGFRWYVHINLFCKFSLKEAVKLEFISKFLNFISPFQLSIPFRSFYLKNKLKISQSLALSLLDLSTDLMITSLLIAIMSYLLKLKFGIVDQI